MTTLNSTGSYTGALTTAQGSPIQVLSDNITMPETGSITAVYVYFAAASSFSTSAWIGIWDTNSSNPVAYAENTALQVLPAGAGNQALQGVVFSTAYVGTRGQIINVGFAAVGAVSQYNYSVTPSQFRHVNNPASYGPQNSLTGSSAIAGNIGWQIMYTPIAPGGAKVWNGTSFDKHPVKTWNGSAWQQHPMKTWDGSAWQSR